MIVYFFNTTDKNTVALKIKTTGIDTWSYGVMRTNTVLSITHIRSYTLETLGQWIYKRIKIGLCMDNEIGLY